MSFATKYKGHFFDLANTRYDYYIEEDGYTGSVTELVTLNEDPLVIEWSSTDKLEPIQSSSATIRLLSKSDRAFIDLYTVEVGKIRMNVMKDGSLYWSGLLDPELYSEPYAYEKNYVVSITFSDFASLDRMMFDGTGFMRLGELILTTLQKSGIKYTTCGFVCSTYASIDPNGSIDGVACVLCDNYYDEDGSPMSWYEVLKETLKPLALRIKQYNGNVYIYDLNSLYEEDSETIQWRGTDSQYEVDSTYNNVRINYSPYEQTTLENMEVEEDSVTGGTNATVYIGTESAADEKGFEIKVSDTGKGVTLGAGKFFKITSIYSGDDCTGVAWTVRTFSSRNSGSYVDYANAPVSTANASLLFKTGKKAYVCQYSNDQYKINISLSLLFDVRYNPFEEDAQTNEEGDYERMKNWANFVYVPVKILLKDEAGNTLYHFENSGVKNSNSFAHTSTNFRWVAGEASWGDCYLCWYQGNRKNETGVGGWQTNKQIIGYYRGEKLPVLFDKMGSGEFIPLPPAAGWIEIEVGTGVDCYDYESSSAWQLREDIYPITRWILYKDLSVKLVDKYGNDVETKDEEINAWINKSAKEEYTIETKVGSMKNPSPVARGQFFRDSDKIVLADFTRNGTTDRLENLLAGTVYSQYADKHIVLSGTTKVLQTFGNLIDKNETGKFVLLSEKKRLADGTSEIEAVQFGQDSYTGIEYNE